MNNYFLIIPMVLIIALIYYGAIWLISKKVANRINKKRADLESQAKVDLVAKAEWEKSIQRRTKAVKTSFSIMKYLLVFIVVMLIIGSIVEIEELINNYKIDGKIFSLKNFKAFTTPIITIFFIHYLVKTYLAKSEKDDI